ncbi:N-acetylmuramoyl-L-alanine amidase [Paenibacillus xerothermodurans]|uniref:Uncharacterized protein n=1 Tax=Paenibacillus xerothermodurans TaxID=1977292 RepID=A0A2W1NDE7_PAEXE|nr:N-acetylmuramoyl-L-alanine amidase [Paenibacillus xerothermodurans]PZE21984.1 hypothetical protein CBW46_006185 [Paenibacillus xerothermodurans]
MQFFGIVIHHSACPAINGKGFDFFISRSGGITPSAEPTDSLFIHICLEGNFHERRATYTAEEMEQLFLLRKLALRLAERFHFEPDDFFPHTPTCPGAFFPWSQLVISSADGYH